MESTDRATSSLPPAPKPSPDGWARHSVLLTASGRALSGIVALTVVTLTVGLIGLARIVSF